MAKEQENEEKRRSLLKQIRDLENELETERRGKVNKFFHSFIIGLFSQFSLISVLEN